VDGRGGSRHFLPLHEVHSREPGHISQNYIVPTSLGLSPVTRWRSSPRIQETKTNPAICNELYRLRLLAKSAAPHLYQPGAQVVVNHDIVAVHLAAVAVVDDNILHTLQARDDGLLDPSKAPVGVLEPMPGD